MSHVTLFTNAVKNTSTPIITFDTDDAVILFDGTFDGETVTIYVLAKDGSQLPLTGGSITAPGAKLVQLYEGARLQLVISNGAGTPSISSDLYTRR